MCGWVAALPSGLTGLPRFLAAWGLWLSMPKERLFSPTWICSTKCKADNNGFFATWSHSVYNLFKVVFSIFLSFYLIELCLHSDFSILGNIANFDWIGIAVGLWASSIVPIVPLRHTPAWNTVDDILTKALEDTCLPLPTHEHFHGVKDFHLNKRMSFHQDVQKVCPCPGYIMVKYTYRSSGKEIILEIGLHWG